MAVRRLVLVGLVGLTVLIGVPASAGAVPNPFPVPAWTTDGSVDALAVSGGTTYLGGRFTQVGPRTGPGAGLDASTGLDLGLAEVGPGLVLAVAPDGAGGWYIGGTFSTVGALTRQNVAHIRTDGSVDPSFDAQPVGYTRVDALAVIGSTVYVGGQFTSIGGQPRNGLAALDGATGQATSWNPNPAGSYVVVYALATSGSTVYVSGEFTSIGGQGSDGLAAIDAATGLSTGWNPGIKGGFALAVSGSTVYAGYPGVSAISADTGAVLWTANTDNPVDALAASGSTVYAGGVFEHIGGQSRKFFAALDAATGVPTAWNPSPDSLVLALTVAGSTVYAGGQFTSVGGKKRPYLAALEASTGHATSWNPRPGAIVRTVAVAASAVYAGGDFDLVNAQPRRNLAAIDNATGVATAWEPKTDKEVDALAISGSTVYAGGFFKAVSGRPRNRIAAIDASTGAVRAWDANANGEVLTLAVSGPTLYAGGAFTSIGGQERTYIAALDTSTGAATSWDPAANGSVDVLALDGGLVYAGGGFGSIGGQSRNAVAALDATTGAATSWNADLCFAACSRPAEVFALALAGPLVYVGGLFSQAGGKSRFDVAAIDASTGVPTGWNPAGSDFPESVRALAVNGSTVYVGGSFTAIGGQASDGLAAIDAATGLNEGWNPPAVVAWALAIEPDGTLAAGNGPGFAVYGPGGQITVTNALVRPTDPGRFDLGVDSTVVKPSAANGGSGSLAVAGGTYVVNEAGANGTDLAAYKSLVYCTKNGAKDVSRYGTSIHVTVVVGDVEACTITNRRIPVVTLRKSLSPPKGDKGRFDLAVGSTVVASAVGNGGSGTGTFQPGKYTLSETAATGSLGDYVSSIACTLSGGAGPSGSGTSLEVTLVYGDLLDCTFTNTRKPLVTVKKLLNPSDDPGRFDLLVDSTVVRAAAGDLGKGSILVAPGAHTVAEQGANGTGLAGYTSSISCTKNGQPDVSGAGTSIGVTVAGHDAEVCTITNTRKP